jgi:hypothetical protein
VTSSIFYKDVQPIFGSQCKGDIAVTGLAAKGYDRDYHFMPVEISGDELYLQTIIRTGVTRDRGVLHRPGAPVMAPGTAPTTPGLVVPASVPLATPAATPTPSSPILF